MERLCQLQRKNYTPITYPTRHETETTESGTDTKGTLTTEFNSDKTERLITGGDQCEVSPAEQVWRKGGKLGLGEDAVGVHLHQSCQFLSSETSIEVNDRADTDELDRRFLLQPNADS